LALQRIARFRRSFHLLWHAYCKDQSNGSTDFVLALTKTEGEPSMADRHEVLCINKSDRTNPHERITHIGGRNGDGSAWKITQQAAIEGIENGKWSFYVSRGGRTVSVMVSTSRYGHKYLKTENDGEQPDNLLSLPECR
jgi:hypothetical protein